MLGNLYLCNTKLNVECEKTHCGTMCTATAKIEYAVRDSNGNPIVQCEFKEDENGNVVIIEHTTTNADKLAKAILERDKAYLLAKNVGNCATCANNNECNDDKVLNCFEGFLKWLDEVAKE